MNYIFISPNYPGGHWRYVAALRQAGHNVYGIGDAGIETFPAELRGNLCDYYRVGDLHNYEEVYKACCYFINRYGRFDAVDSLNPYWCDLVAAVSRDFIENRTSPEEQYSILRNNYMYKRKGSERRILSASDSDDAAQSAETLGGYPVLLIPSKDKRLGVRRVDNEEDLRGIFDTTEETWQIRRYAEGEPLSVDCLCECCEEDLPFPARELRPILWGIHVFGGDGCVWSLPITENSLAQLAENVLPSFFSDRNGLVFFHADCVKLKKAVKGLGKKGDIILNEWWQTPPHEMVIDCMNIEYDCDIRGIWAMNEAPEKPLEQVRAAGIASRSFERSYKNSHEKILRRLAGKLKAHSRTGGFDVGTFLDYYYIFSGPDTADIKRNIKFITEDHAPQPRVTEETVSASASNDAVQAVTVPEEDAARPDDQPHSEDYSVSFREALESLTQTASIFPDTPDRGSAEDGTPALTVCAENISEDIPASLSDGASDNGGTDDASPAAAENGAAGTVPEKKKRKTRTKKVENADN